MPRLTRKQVQNGCADLGGGREQFEREPANQSTLSELKWYHMERIVGVLFLFLSAPLPTQARVYTECYFSPSLVLRVVSCGMM